MKYLILLLALSLPTKAEETNIFLGGWSKHFNIKREKNETHDMIAIQYKNIMFSPYFVNSEGNEAQYVGYYDNLYQSESNRIWYTYGLVSGYPNTIVAAQLGYSYTKMINNDTGAGFNLSVMPIPNNGKLKGVAVFTIGLKYRF